MNNAKKRAIILMVLGAVIGAVAVGVYFLQNDRTPPTTDTPPTATSTPSIFDMEPIIPEAKVSTEGWKTCRNEEYGWEIKYPGEWYVWGEGSEVNEHRIGIKSSGICKGDTVTLSTNGGEEGWVDGREAVEVTVKVSSSFEGSHISHLQTVRLEDVVGHLKAQNVSFGYVIVGGKKILYTQQDSNNTLGATVFLFSERDKYSVINLIFYNMRNDLLETFLNTFLFSIPAENLEP